MKIIKIDTDLTTADNNISEKCNSKSLGKNKLNSSILKWQ